MAGNTLRRAALQGRARRPGQDEFPLLGWLVTELQERTDGLDGRSALRTARHLLEEAFASVDRLSTQVPRKETSR